MGAFYSTHSSYSTTRPYKYVYIGQNTGNQNRTWADKKLSNHDINTHKPRECDVAQGFPECWDARLMNLTVQIHRIPYPFPNSKR